MKINITLEADGFSWVCTMPVPEGEDMKTFSPTAHGAVYAMAAKIKEEAESHESEEAPRH